MAQVIKTLSAVQETWVWSLGQEDPLEKGLATHASILTWSIPGTEESGRIQSWDCKEADITVWITLYVSYTFKKRERKPIVEFRVTPRWSPVTIVNLIKNCFIKKVKLIGTRNQELDISFKDTIQCIRACSLESTNFCPSTVQNTFILF